MKTNTHQQSAIITSLLDNDLYKFSMHQAVLHQFPAAEVVLKFKCRNDGIIWSSAIVAEITAQIEALTSLNFTEDELAYLATLRFLKADYIDFLRIFRLQQRYIKIYQQQNELHIEISGPWLHTILFEVPVLAIVNEVYFRHHAVNNLDYAQEQLSRKIAIIKTFPESFKFSDFGTRRRYTKDWHHSVIGQIVEQLPGNFLGTSNVLFAKEFKVTPIGTMAHEWLQAGQALTRIRDSQKFMFQKWADVYRGDLGIALSDVVGVDAFIRDFDLYFAKLFDGCRQDSGCPFEWGEKIIQMYQKLRIDPATKVAVFSDSLDINKAKQLYDRFHGRLKVMFGIGTNLTNDVGVEPLNIVIKMVTCNGMPVAKIADGNGTKGMCEDEEYLKYLKSQFLINV